MVPFASLFTHCDLSAHLISLLDSYYFTFANLKARAEALYLATKPVLDKEPRFRNGNDRALIEKYQVSSNSLSHSHFRSSFVSAFFSFPVSFYVLFSSNLPFPSVPRPDSLGCFVLSSLRII